MAWIVEQVQRPTLVIAHNKTLAAQLCNEFREFLPENAVEYFVSYYDYYQPEAYVPQADLYIEKDASINDDIDRLRHAATAALLARKDVLIVASVSCIYGIGSPEAYGEKTVALGIGQEIDRDVMLRKLVDIQYARNDSILGRGRFRVRGRRRRGAAGAHGVGLPHLASSATRSSRSRTSTRSRARSTPGSSTSPIFPATQYVTSRETIERAVGEIKHELAGAGEAVRRRRGSCSRRTGSGSAPSTTWRCCRSSATATGSRTTRASSTAARPGRRRTRCSTSSATTSWS